MSVSQILTDYNGQPTSLCIAGGGGGGGVVSVSAGPGLTITGTPTINPIVNLGFTATQQLIYGTGLNTAAVLNPGANNDFLRLNNSGNLEWHPISAGGVVSVSANPGGACFVNNSNASTPAVALAFPAGDKGAIPASNGTGVNQGAFLAGPTALQQNYVLAADNMSAVGFSWKAAAGVAITGEAPLVEFIDGTLTKVGIDFGVGAAGIGQIPVGISNPTGKLGTLTPALTVAEDGYVLTASSAAAAAGGVVWAPPVAPGGSVLRVLTAAQNIPAPTVNNETLTIIDTAPAGSGFVINLLPNPVLVDSILAIRGAVPYRLTAGEEGYLVYGYLTDKTSNVSTGVIYKYVPDVVTPANGVWTLRAITQGPPVPAPPDAFATFEGACVLNPVIADGGRPPIDADYIFCGNFTTVADANGANPVVSTQFVKYEAGTDVFVVVPLTSGPFTEGINNVVGVPNALVGAIGTFLLLAAQPIVIASAPAVDYGLICIYDGAGGIKTIGGSVGDQFDPVSDAAFDTSNRLWIGGGFEGYQTGSIIYTAKKLACLSAGASAFSVNNPLPYNFIRGDSIDSVQNSYNGALISITGVFSSTQTPPTTNFGVITIGGLNDLALSQVVDTSGFIPGRCLLIDVNTYVVAIGTQGGTDGPGALSGRDSGTTAIFAKGLVDITNTSLNWNYKAIAAGGDNLNFIDFDFFYDTDIDPPTDIGNAFSGYFNGSSGGGSVLTFVGGATVRYPKTSGAIGDATTATIQGAYSSLSLIGDLPNNKWDLISTTGTVVFSP